MKKIQNALVTLVALFCLALLTMDAYAQNGPNGVDAQDRKTMTALRLAPEESIDLDGKLDEAVWKRATPADGFTQIDPNNGAPPTEPTEVFVVFDRDRLYIGVICYDSEPDKLMGNTMLRDAFLSADDRFMWVFDTYLDARSGYFFEINPSGAMGDNLLGSSDGRSWDGIWTAKVNRSEIGWTAEIEVPFRTLNFDPTAQAWGINFQRTVRRKSEETIWRPFARNQELRTLSTAGLLVGLSDISQGAGIEVKPYLIGSAGAAPARGLDNSYTGDTGVDIGYSITPKLRASFTVNTDFAETEVDDRIVNLTRFPVRFPEKRQFFLEGSNYFTLTGYDTAFFSRRIGLNEGTVQRIDYGAKLTGQVGSEDLGILQVRTAQEGSLLGEDFTILRSRHRFLSESHVGMLYTRRAVRPDMTLNPVASLTPDLHTLGFDFATSTRRFRGNKNLQFESHYVHTSNPAGTGHSGRYGARISYPNDVINMNLGFAEDQENLDPAVGFVSRTGKDWNGNFQFRPRPQNHPWIRQFSFGVNYSATTSSTNVLETHEINITAFQVNTHAGDNVRFQVTPNYDLLNTDFRMQGGIILPRGSDYNFTRYTVGGDMSNRRKVAFRGSFNWGNYYGGKRREFNPGLALRPRNGLILDLSGQWNRIELPQGSFSTSLLRSVINSQFSPWISVSSNLQYDSVSRVLGWQGRFRWILKPGNDLYFVYTRNWNNDAAAGMTTIDHKAASKLVYTHRF